MFAKWNAQTGFSVPAYRDKGVVKILGFVETTIYPSYQSSGSKTCVCAIVADEHGALRMVELTELTYVGEDKP